MKEEMERTALLLGEDGIRCLQDAHVMVFGVGGVGGFCIEALARTGIGRLTIVDHDVVSLSNINRQIIADHSTVGLPKIQVMKERIAKINPDCKVDARDCFYLPESAGQFDFSDCDYIVDAIDTVTAKIQLIVEADKNNVPVISCMGAGNKLDPTKFQVADIYKTSVCPLAKVMRQELKARKIKNCKVVYSTEPAKKITPFPGMETSHKIVGSLAFVPSVAGMILAGEVIKDIARISKL